MSNHFGRVCAIENSPSTVDEFKFWLARGLPDKVEVGYIVTAENPETKERVFGLVTDIKFFTDAQSVLIDYFSHEFGTPEAQPPTERQEIHIATASVIGSSPNRARPMSSGLVRLATVEEIHKAYGMDQINNKIFCGVITNGPNPDNWAPSYMDEKFLLGPEGAHLNISGASGLATKTSAAIFLISSVLSAAKLRKKKFAVLAFNVKGGDLLRLGRGGEDGNYSQDELLELIESSGSPETRKILDLAKKNNVDMCFNPSNLKMYAPARASDISKPNSLLEEGVKPFYWSLTDVLREDAPVRLTDLFETGDIDDKSFGVLGRIEELLEDEQYWGGGKVTSFSELIQKISNSLGSKTKGIWGNHHHSTVMKVARLVKTNCEGILNGLFAIDEEKGKDIAIENIAPGELWVADIEAINDRAKRLVFHNLTTRLANFMEIESLKPVDERRLHGIVIFVDELNKFAPSGSTRSRIKQQIIELAARGRSLGIILFGAEQFASRVDKEVIGNASSHFLGRTEIVELQDRTYGWLAKDLRFIIGNLEKGRLLLRHATYGRPVFMKFPQPLYNYSTTAIDDLLKSKDKDKTKKPIKADKHEDQFVLLKSILRKKRGITPLKIYSEVKGIKKQGIQKNQFCNWYGSWTSRNKYSGRGKTEKRVLQIVIDHYSK